MEMINQTHSVDSFAVSGAQGNLKNSAALPKLVHQTHVAGASNLGQQVSRPTEGRLARRPGAGGRRGRDVLLRADRLVQHADERLLVLGDGSKEGRVVLANLRDDGVQEGRVGLDKTANLLKLRVRPQEAQVWNEGKTKTFLFFIQANLKHNGRA